MDAQNVVPIQAHGGPKAYLGDGVYARFPDSGEIMLTTEDGISVQNVVILERSTLALLVSWVAMIDEQSRSEAKRAAEQLVFDPETERLVILGDVREFGAEHKPPAAPRADARSVCEDCGTVSESLYDRAADFDADHPEAQGRLALCARCFDLYN
jgi:hypothetical protein